MPQGVHHRITDALPSSPERITPHHPGSGQAPDALDLAVRLLARQGNQENVVVTVQENIVVTPAVITCFSCWGRDFWRGSGAVVCRRCHPPAPGAEVLP